MPIIVFMLYEYDYLLLVEVYSNKNCMLKSSNPRYRCIIRHNLK